MDRDHFSNLSLPQPKEDSHEILATLAQRHQRRSRLKFSTFFPYKCMIPIQMHREQIWPRRKKVKRQCTTIILAILVDLSSPMICAQIQPQGVLSSGEEAFKVFFTIYWHGGHLGQRTMSILAIFRFPNLRRLLMEFEQNWLIGFRGKVVWKCERTDGRRTKSDHNSSSWA